jgi:serine/threonine protein kinase
MMGDSVTEFAPGGVVDGRYELGRQLGAGGMARVYLAHDRLLDREVAVKVLAERYASDPAFVERFRREASAAAGLNHPNIVSVYDRGEADGSYYIVMEYLDGPDLKQVIRGRGHLTPAESVDAALQILSALRAAHRRDVIHRDVKPQNVMVAEDGRLKVTDFGIARAGADSSMTEVGSVIGTAQYLSPEQARGEEVTAASDCYAVGIVLYEMLTGRVPFDGERPVAVAG